ncbi:sugar kinase [Haloarcula sp. GH36]|uniref:sugar kinase n=1 Tax=Haloarcula montana TaxID=3111776 RepID=UPI002D774F6E|nr:sugar kinase [Haloarcula sp. GH36]
MTLVSFGETALRFAPPEGHRFETAREVSLRADGTASNVATTASRLGTESVWLSKLPDTPLGRRVVAELHEHGLETEVVWSDDGDRQGLTFYEDAAPPREDRLIQDRERVAAATITPGELPMDVIQAADVVFAAGSTAALSDTAAETLGAVLRATSGARALDLDFDPGLWDADTARERLERLFDAVDVLFLNEAEATTVFDRSGSPRELTHTLASSYDFDYVFLTRSEHGAVAYHDGVVHERDAIETDIVDSSGQHDAFVGAIIDRLIAGSATDEALLYGTAAAALARTMPGPLVPIEAEEVAALVDRETSGRR